MEYKKRDYPQFAACGLNCGLCPRYYTVGSTRCPGCAGEGFSEVHPSCGILSCSQRKELDYCFECEEFPCKKFDKWGDADSFITHKNYLSDMEKARKNGIDAYKTELNAKIKVLKKLLADYNDGRQKSFYCLAINLLELEDILAVMEQLVNDVDLLGATKEKTSAAVAIFNKKADEKGISLKMRK
ncbi:MAG: DUF3795 domain-containing protein [Oscillospiraceae bacterium]|nr:DUF3795 domain-containing protein [Oscillospiraceae bacterium]